MGDVYKNLKQNTPIVRRQSNKSRCIFYGKMEWIAHSLEFKESGFYLGRLQLRAAESREKNLNKSMPLSSLFAEKDLSIHPIKQNWQIFFNKQAALMMFEQFFEVQPDIRPQ